MGFLSNHPKTIISDTVDHIVQLNDESELDYEIERLVRLIRGRDSSKYEENQQEIARKLRKLLKLNESLLVKLNCFKILNNFIINGLKFGIVYNDAKLLNIIQVTCTVSGGRKKEVFRKYVLLWYTFICENGVQRNRCYVGLIDTYKNIHKTVTSKNGSSSMVFDIQKHTPKIKILISDALSTSIQLSNALLQLPRGCNSVDDELATKYFVKARDQRRKILKYLQVIQSGELLGSLIHANDELVKALKEYDSKSGLAIEEQHHYSGSEESSYYETEAESEEETRFFTNDAADDADEHDPFGDHHRI